MSFPVNINRLYSQVRAASGDDQVVVPDSSGGRLESAKDGSESVSAEDIRKFRQDLFASLSGTGVGETVLKDLRARLGIPLESTGEVSVKPLLAREIKDAIELVMKQIDASIGKILGKDFPRQVKPLVLEAVRENPQHAIVKALLQKGSAMNLARLCRLTALSQEKSSLRWELAYLKGFSYKVSDEAIADVKRIGDVAEEAKARQEGEADFDIAAARECKLKASEWKNAFTEGLGEKAAVVVKALDGGLQGKALRDEILRHLANEAKGEFVNEMKKCLAWPGGENALGLTDAEKAEVFVMKMLSKWPKTASGKNVENAIKTGLGNAGQSATESYVRLAGLRVAVTNCEAKISTLKVAAGDGKESLVQSLQFGLLKEVENLRGLAPESALYEKLCKASVDEAKPEGTVAQTVEASGKKLAEVLGAEIEKVLGLSSKKLMEASAAPKALTLLTDGLPSAAKERKDGDDSRILAQGTGSSMCYVRSLENSLLAKDRVDLLPKKGEEGNFTFPVKLDGGKSLTVTANEIKALQKWYEKKHANKKVNEIRLMPSDWAVNLALAKLAMYKANKAAAKPATDVGLPKAFEVDEEGSAKSGYEDRGFSYKDYLEKQLITEFGFDDQVAELLGLGEVARNVPINFHPKIQMDMENVKQGKIGPQPELAKTEIFANWNGVREWIEANPDGIVTLNEGAGHTVAVTGCYYENDGNFGFVVRDSLQDRAGVEQKVNVVGYGRDEETNLCRTLNVHCYVLPEKVEK